MLKLLGPGSQVVAAYWQKIRFWQKYLDEFSFNIVGFVALLALVILPPKAEIEETIKMIIEGSFYIIRY